MDPITTSRNHIKLTGGQYLIYSIKFNTNTKWFSKNQIQIGYLLSFLYFKKSKQDFLILFHSFQARFFSLLFFNFQKKSLPFLPITLIHSIPLKFTHFIPWGTLKQSVMFYFSFCGPFFMVYNHSITQWRRWVIMFIFVLAHAFHFCICFWVFGFWVWKY